MPELIPGLAPDELRSFRDLAGRLVVAFALGWLVAGVHYLTAGRPSGRTDRSFLVTLILMAVVIALVTMVIGNSTARAFSLAGALAIVRFRTPVTDTRDTAFVIYAVAAGMAAGIGTGFEWKDLKFVAAAVASAPLVFLAAWPFRKSRDAPPPSGVASLALRLAAGRPPDERVRAVLDKFVPGHQLTGLSTARGGAALDATYAVRTPAPDAAYALMAELNALDSVQGVELKGGS